MRTGLVEGTVVSVKEYLIRIKFDKLKVRPNVGVTVCEGDREIDFVLTKDGAEILIDELRSFFNLDK
jgi:hypothetical protein